MILMIRFAATILILALVGCGQQQDPDTPVVNVPVASAADLFPLRVASSGSYLEDSSGRPFLIHGDSPWGLIVQLSREDVDFYLEDRRARGFNTILVRLLDDRFADHAPANYYDDSPFHEPGNFATPNEAYFAHADWVLLRARELGFAVLLVPAYLGYGGGDQGLYQQLVKSSSRSLLYYGRYLGKRYQHLDHIIWTHGGDFNPPRKRAVQLIARGIHEYALARPATAHCGRETAAADLWGDESWLTLNNVYTRKPVFEESYRQLDLHPTMPFFLLEGVYENEHSSTPQSLRTQAYHALLSGACGQVFGNNPIWHFDGPGLYPAPLTWKEALDSQGSRSMSILSSLFAEIDWWTLIPDVENQLLVEGSGEGHDRSIAARYPDSTLAIAFLPSVRPLAIDPTTMEGRMITADWFDPTTGDWFSDPNSPFPTNTVAWLQPPGRNTANDTDWVLILRSKI